ncbi:Gfo/Idh/MocA family oxidoreductase [Jiangella aurantiaca]|uniref:Gfo/Idh/MocA family oxidoreductase n=1 Tax=Jiangella aurantiaca TaxID=2530373 RepID=A0A4R5AKK1_9ACTN|nr:Gfo/Idh/MocA family oxidoreductase [Jiangella aurantiaca]TDD72365.1 Gfo/Idh/MocA family oxidoreductase [Jiangella aurantiaca]
MTDFDAPVRLLVIGAGNRGGQAYAGWCLRHPEAAVVTGIADRDEERLAAVGDVHGVPAEHRYGDWRTALSGPGPWDAVIVTTPDRMHVDPTLRALELGYDVLLEKPIAPTPSELDRLIAAAKDRPGAITVSHVMRYTPFFNALKRLLDEGHIGDLQGVQHAEHIAYWHFAHSYVRGNWHRAADSSPMLLAKACHDLDILRWLVGSPCIAVSSFGDRRHFRIENAPPGSTDRCIDGCAVAASCPYNAHRFYVEQLAGVETWPVSVITSDPSPEGRLKALRETDYGRCVYRMDNDVVDHQTTSLRYANGVTASLVVSAFTERNTRLITMMGSHGEINADLDAGRIEVVRFGASGPTVAGLPPAERYVERVSGGHGGHSGGDAGLTADFAERIRRRRAGLPVQAAPSAFEESLESHWVAFAAERSRQNGTVEYL